MHFATIMRVRYPNSFAMVLVKEREGGPISLFVFVPWRYRASKTITKLVLVAANVLVLLGLLVCVGSTVSLLCWCAVFVVVFFGSRQRDSHNCIVMTFVVFLRHLLALFSSEK